MDSPGFEQLRVLNSDPLKFVVLVSFSLMMNKKLILLFAEAPYFED